MTTPLNLQPIDPTRLGDAGFRADYGLKYAYTAGAMYKGIASEALVIALAKAGLIGYFGTGGLTLAKIEAAIDSIQSRVGGGASLPVSVWQATHLMLRGACGMTGGAPS